MPKIYSVRVSDDLHERLQRAKMTHGLTGLSYSEMIRSGLTLWAAIMEASADGLTVYNNDAILNTDGERVNTGA